MGPITVNLKKIAGGAPIDLAAGDIQVLQPFLAWFDGTQLILLYPAATAAAGVMTGVMLDYGGATAPTGYLLCDGTAVSRTTYSDLFTVIGTLFGVGDGSTTFNVPDRRGRSSAGLDNMGGTSADTITDTAADIVGGVFGAETHTMTTAEIAEHGHTGSTNSTGSHTHTHNSYTNYISTGTGGTISGHAMYYAELGNATGSSGIHSHIVTISNTGSTTPFSIVDPKLFTNVIIKT
ncbi:MAG TPA: tail fiber protein [Gammaproteobacteria bacterium]|nr:tail fiber protein [Gammaproteobacteria bacterium]